VRVVIADDVMLTREGIARVLAAAGVEVVGEAGDVDGLMRAVATQKPDCAIVDIRMPPTNTDEGIVAAQRIRELHPGVGVLVLSQYVEPGFAMRLLEENPERSGYLLKERISDPAILVDALRRLTNGETVVDASIVSRLLARRREPDPVDGLSERERGVLALVAEGLSNREIGRRLFITERTVEAHVKQIFQKLGLGQAPETNRRVLAVLAFLRSNAPSA
jgi:DNA-binding NarL/FixJ family response regulator